MTKKTKYRPKKRVYKRKKTKKAVKSFFKSALLRGMTRKKAMVVIPVLAVLLFFSIAAAVRIASNKFEVIMVIDKKACHCVKRRCVTLDTQVSGLIDNKFKNKVKIRENSWIKVF